VDVQAIGHLTPPASPATQSILDHHKTKQVEFEEHKLYRSLVGFIWQRFHEVISQTHSYHYCIYSFLFFI
jgi:hypothetical protein